MSIRGHGKKVWRVLLVSLLLVLSLNTVASAADSEDYESQVIWDLAQISEKLSIIYESLETYPPVIQDYLYYSGKSAANYLYLIESDLTTVISTLDSSYTVLAGMQSSLENIDADASSISSTLSTIAGYLVYSGKSVTYYVRLFNNNMLTRTEDIIEYQAAAATDLATMITKLTSVDTDLDTVIEKLSALNDNIFTVWTEVVSVNTNLGTVIEKQNLYYPYIYDISTDLEDACNYLITINNNIGLLVTAQRNANATLSNIEGLLTYNEYSAANIMGYVNNNLLLRTGEIIDQQEAAAAKLDTVITKLTTANTSLSTIATEITSADSRLGTVVTKITSVDTNISSVVTKITSVDTNLSSVVTKITSVDTNLSSVVTSQSDILAVLADALDELESIDSSIHGYSDEIKAVASASTTMSSKLTSVLDNQAVLHSNIVSVITKITSADNRLNTVNTNLTTMIGNQSELLTLLQEDGVFTTDISGVLTDLDSVLSNQSTLVTSLAGVSTNLSSVVTKITSADNRLNTVNTNLTTMLGNQNDLLALLRQDGAFTTDVTGILANQQKLIELLEDLNATTVENIQNITIDVTNEAYEIFYITDIDGTEQNLGDFSGDILTISGRLLNFFFKVAFDDAMNSVDSALDDMTGFYLDDSVVLEGGSLWE